MTALSGIGQSMQQSLSPQTTTQSGLGKWFGVMSAVQALGTVGAGVQQWRNAGADADTMNQQAQLVAAQAEMDSTNQAREGRRFAAEQEQAYASSGVTMEGTPADIIAESRRLAQEEVNATVNRGKTEAKNLRTNALRTRQSGRQALLGGVANASFGLLGNYIQGQLSFGAKGKTTPVGKAVPLGPTYTANAPIGL